MMKKWLACLLCALLCACGATALAGEINGALFEGGSATLRPELLGEALPIASQQGKDATAAYLESLGFAVLRQVGYDKADDDPAHTSAYTVAERTVETQGAERALLCVTIRGTGTMGEWMSNFNFAPSHSDDTAFSENFFFAAEAIYDDIKADLDRPERPIVLVTGYSRGAACANLLGVLLDRVYGPEDIFVYTFATPTTMRGERAEDEYPNIFNVVNPRDIVTHMPLAAWGYKRPGTDIVLGAEAEELAAVEAAVAQLAALAPGISSYYADRHSLTGPGLAEQGLTAYEFLLSLSTSMMPGQGMGDQTSQMGQMGQMSQMGRLMEGGSDFGGLLALMAQSAEGATVPGVPAFMAQHMPDVYRALLAEMSL